MSITNHIISIYPVVIVGACISSMYRWQVGLTFVSSMMDVAYIHCFCMAFQLRPTFLNLQYCAHWLLEPSLYSFWLRTCYCHCTLLLLLFYFFQPDSAGIDMKYFISVHVHVHEHVHLCQVGVFNESSSLKEMMMASRYSLSCEDYLIRSMVRCILYGNKKVTVNSYYF